MLEVALLLIRSAVCIAGYPPNLMWSISQGGTSTTDEICSSVSCDNANNIIITTTDVSSRWPDYCHVIRFNYNGTGTDDRLLTEERLRCSATDQHGNYYVGGLQSIKIYQCLFAYNSNGTELWHDYGKGGNSFGDYFGLATDGSGNVIACGRWAVENHSEEDPATKYDWLIRKYSSGGNILWTVTTNGTPHQYATAYSITADSNGNLIAVGEITTTTTSDWLIRKYDPNGKLIWSKTGIVPSTPAHPVEARTVAIDKTTENIVLAGCSYQGNYNWHIRMYGPAGNAIWQKTISGGANRKDKAIGVAIDSRGYIIVAGYVDAPNDSTTPYEGGNMHFRVLSRQGIDQCGVTYASPSGLGSAAYAVAVDKDDNIVVAGYEDRTDLGQGLNWLVRKYERHTPATATTTNTPEIKLVGGKDGAIDPTLGEKYRAQIKIYGNCGTMDWYLDIKVYDMKGRLVKEMKVKYGDMNISIRTETVTRSISSQSPIVQEYSVLMVDVWDGKDINFRDVPIGPYHAIIKGPGIQRTMKVAVTRRNRKVVRLR